MSDDNGDNAAADLAALDEVGQRALLERHSWCRRLQLRGCLEVGMVAARMGADASACARAALQRWQVVDGLWAAVHPAWTPPATTSADLLEEAMTAMHTHRQEQCEALPTHLVPALLAIVQALRVHLRLN